MYHYSGTSEGTKGPHYNDHFQNPTITTTLGPKGVQNPTITATLGRGGCSVYKVTGISKVVFMGVRLGGMFFIVGYAILRWTYRHGHLADNVLRDGAG